MKKGHCKNCVYHSNAGHPEGARDARFNDWCTHHSTTAKKAQSICKLQNSKKVR